MKYYIEIILGISLFIKEIVMKYIGVVGTFVKYNYVILFAIIVDISLPFFDILYIFVLSIISTLIAGITEKPIFAQLAVVSILSLGLNTTFTNDVEEVSYEKVYIPSSVSTIKFHGSPKDINKFGVYNIKKITTHKTSVISNDKFDDHDFEITRLDNLDCSHKFEETKIKNNRKFILDNDDICPNLYKNKSFTFEYIKKED